MTAYQRLGILIAVALLVAVALVLYVQPDAPSLPAYAVDIEQTSVSGVSSGGAMAVQMHVAHSSIMRGVGVTAGVAYDCADSSLPFETQRIARGLFCVAGSVDADFSIAQTNAAASVPGAIDDPAANLPGQKVWLFSGYNDGAVRRDAMNALGAYYEHYVGASNVFYKTNSRAPHALITDDYGASCLSVGTDYVNNCDYDSAARLLEHIYGHLVRPTGAANGSILEFDQGEFVAGDPKSVGLAKTGYVYVPSSCETGPCRAHVVFHGCKQYAKRVGDAVYGHAGYNEWADENGIIVLYPQTVATSGSWYSSGPINPKGCWDWWGYSVPDTHRRDFARKAGYQITAIKAMLDRLAENFVPGGSSQSVFGTPQHLSVPDRTATSTDLIWQADGAASGFNVYRAPASAGPFAKVNASPVPGASFADRGLDPETTYHYRLTAIEQGSGVESAPTSPVAMTTAAVPAECDAYFGTNVSHVPARAWVGWLNRTYALGTNDSMGQYSSTVETHLVKEGLLSYRVGYCP